MQKVMLESVFIQQMNQNTSLHSLFLLSNGSDKMLICTLIFFAFIEFNYLQLLQRYVCIVRNKTKQY